MDLGFLIALELVVMLVLMAVAVAVLGSDGSFVDGS